MALKPDDIELRKWCVDAAIRVVEGVVKSLPQNPGTSNNVNINVIGTSIDIHDFVTGVIK